jgi:hypothetical protein
MGSREIAKLLGPSHNSFKKALVHKVNVIARVPASPVGNTVNAIDFIFISFLLRRLNSSLKINQEILKLLFQKSNYMKNDFKPFISFS